VTNGTIPSRPGRAGTANSAADGSGDTPARQALLLAPSRGLGGGIERYVQTVQSAFDEQGVTSRRLDLGRPGPAGHRALLAGSRDALGSMAGPVRLVIAHRALLPVAAMLARSGRLDGISVICHGSDVWGPRRAARQGVESWLMRRPDVRLVAVSSYTAGALVQRGPATILPPGLSRAWFGELVSAADQASAAAPAAPGDGTGAELEIMTAFRLDDWRDKGLPQLTAAISALGRPGMRLSVCGSGTPPAALLAHLRQFPWCTLQPGLSDAGLAARFAKSGLFVLATKTRPGRRPSGEGFGLVLLEAQVAGTAVVGPAHGGSPDAYLDGVTGATPRDESVPALTRVLAELCGQPGRLAGMGAQGASWARARFNPDRYAALAVSRLL
jgi:phosphatidylinositol alpha-1,6-mannosyltransferase